MIDLPWPEEPAGAVSEPLRRTEEPARVPMGLDMLPEAPKPRKRRHRSQAEWDALANAVVQRRPDLAPRARINPPFGGRHCPACDASRLATDTVCRWCGHAWGDYFPEALWAREPCLDQCIGCGNFSDPLVVYYPGGLDLCPYCCHRKKEEHQAAAAAKALEDTDDIPF